MHPSYGSWSRTIPNCSSISPTALATATNTFTQSRSAFALHPTTSTGLSISSLEQRNKRSFADQSVSSISLCPSADSKSERSGSTLLSTLPLSCSKPLMPCSASRSSSCKPAVSSGKPTTRTLPHKSRLSNLVLILTASTESTLSTTTDSGAIPTTTP